MVRTKSSARRELCAIQVEWGTCFHYSSRESTLRPPDRDRVRMRRFRFHTTRSSEQVAGLSA